MYMQMWAAVMANGTESRDEREMQMWMFVLHIQLKQVLNIQ